MCWCVRTLVTLEQEGNISLVNLEAQLETLLEAVVTFNPPGGVTSPTGSAAWPSSASNDCCSFLHRDRVGAEAHGVLRPVRRHSGLIERSRGLHRRGTCCPHYYLVGSEGPGLSDPASPYSLFPLPCFCTPYDTHHGGMHHSILQPW